ncbi:MAG: PAS domain S-box protein [Deltaproteobacteria bacterium]|nr:PAS domain S-box protein [Deltaproteobacteria bacterium]
MLRRNIAITGLILTALSLAALVVVEMRFADAVIGAASMPSEAFTGGRRLAGEASRHRGTFLTLSFFSFTALAIAAALVVTTRKKRPLANAPCIHSENFEKVSLAYRELLARYQGLMEITPSALIEIDLRGNIVSLNGPARKLTGHPEDGRTPESPLKGFNPLRGLSPFAQFLPAQNRAELDELFDDIRQGNTMKSRQLPFVRDDGGVIRLDVSGAPLWNDGKVWGYLISIHDANRADRLAIELEDARRVTEETTDQLKKTILDIEEFALLAVKREVKMQEIREKLKRFKEGHGEDIVH